MVSVHEATLSSGDGIVLVEDLDYEAVSAAIGGAFADSAGPPGTRGGAKLFGSSGGILLIRCAHQCSRPLIRVEVWDTVPEVFEAPWQWQERRTLTLGSGGFCVTDGDGFMAAPLTEIDAGAGPGDYHVVFGHDGRDAARTEISRIRRETFRLTATESDAVWRRLIGVERYLLRVWPAEV